jgi:GntR family transcriptional repressor for pyruvate dehydrogenase complex
MTHGIAMKKKSTEVQATSTERVLEWIQHYIESRDLKPGDALPKELEMAESIGVARSSVREALTALKALGIITSRKKGGIRIVREPVLLGMREYLTVKYATKDCFFDAMEFRAVLEHGLAELIFRQISRREVASLRKILDDLDNAPNGEADVWNAEKRFHTILTSASRNKLAQLLCALYTPVFDTIQDVEKVDYTPKDWVREHTPFVESLEKNDKDGFMNQMRTHTIPYVRLSPKRNP